MLSFLIGGTSPHAWWSVVAGGNGMGGGMAYIFYDTETTGTETAFDQILQFAAIKTDNELNELDRFQIRSRIQPHVVPAPKALRITRVTPAMLIDPTLPSHYEAIGKIRAKMLEWSPATFIGYNSIAFDEELLRQALFQTLRPAYLTNTNRNARADAMRIAHATSVYAPNVISVPIEENGRETFRLQKLAPANGFKHDDAHEAMEDVVATLYMARLMRERACAVWDNLARCCQKRAVVEYVNGAQMLSLTERYGSKMYSYLVTGCGQNAGNDGQIAMFDLAHDPERYRKLSVNELVPVLNKSPKVIRAVRANAQPILMPANAAPEGTAALKVDPAELQRRAGMLRGDEKFRVRVGQAMAKRYDDREPAEHVEQRIYDGFPGAADQERMAEFHEVDWDKRASIAARIEDRRLNEFAHRLIWSERPDVLVGEEAARMRAWVKGRVLTPDDVPWMTIPRSLTECEDMLGDASGHEAEAINDIKAYLQNYAARIEAL